DGIRDRTVTGVQTCALPISEEWAKRIDLAAAYRLVHLYGMDEMIANHISTRVPGEDNAFLINPYGMLYDQMHASCFIKLDLDGRSEERRVGKECRCRWWQEQ